MSKFIINGGNKLVGKYTLQSAKNSVLPLIASVIIYNNEVTIKNVSKLSDIITMCELFKGLGGRYKFENGDLVLNPSGIYHNNLSEGPCKTIRSSFFRPKFFIRLFCSCFDIWGISICPIIL